VTYGFVKIGLSRLVSWLFDRGPQRLDLQCLLVVHAKALNRSTKTVTLTTSYSFGVFVWIAR